MNVSLFLSETICSIQNHLQNPSAITIFTITVTEYMDKYALISIYS